MPITGLFLISGMYLDTDFWFSKGHNAKQAKFTVKKILFSSPVRPQHHDEP
jgi:hypothetical protein